MGGDRRVKKKKKRKKVKKYEKLGIYSYKVYMDRNNKAMRYVVCVDCGKIAYSYNINHKERKPKPCFNPKCMDKRIERARQQGELD